MFTTSSSWLLAASIPSLRQDAAGSHDQDHDPQYAYYDPLERVDQAGIAELRQERRQLDKEDLHAECPYEHSPIVADAAENNARENRKRLCVAPRPRRPGADELHQQTPTQPGNRPAHQEHLQP